MPCSEGSNRAPWALALLAGAGLFASVGEAAATTVPLSERTLGNLLTTCAPSHVGRLPFLLGPRHDRLLTLAGDTLPWISGSRSRQLPDHLKGQSIEERCFRHRLFERPRI